MNNDIRKIFEIAALAPSSHNTQPWSVVSTKHDVVVGYDPNRQLIVGDPNKRELFISLGCFIETAVLAGNDLGYKVIVTFLGTNSTKVARLHFTKSTSTKTQWISLINLRRSDRRLFATRKLDNVTQSKLHAISEGNASIKIMTDVDLINFIAEQTSIATKSLMTPQAFRDELASWVRNNWTKKHDGMPGYTQGMPGVVSLLAKFVIKKNKGVASDQAKKDSKRILRSSAIGIISVKSENPVNWVSAGRVFQRACLTALQSGVKTSAISASLIDRQTNKNISNKLSLKNHPVALLRFGYDNHTPKRSPRLHIEEFAQI